MLGIAIASLGLAASLVVGWDCLPTMDGVMAGTIATIEWMKTAGPLGHLAFVVFYGIQTVLMVPASWSHGTAGFLYGPLLGPVVASACATGFSAINFFLGRTVLRGWVERRIANSPRLSAIDAAIGGGGAWLVFVVRLPPLSPFNPMSYIMGATKVRFRDFLLGTWLGGLIPVTFFSWLGSSASDLAALYAGEVEATGMWMQVIPLVLTLGVTLYVTRFAKRALDEALEQPAEA
jgi:uncharacterized membrane protein YdjX (TVP38/TMEM64 family)